VERTIDQCNFQFFERETSKYTIFHSILETFLNRRDKFFRNITTFYYIDKEAITNTVEIREVYKKQSGGRGKFADIIVKVGPADSDFDGSLQFIDVVKGGNIPKEFIPSIQKGFQNAMKNGVLAGFPLEKLKVTLIDGSFHAVDSDQLSFEICALIK
jgi:translation elongation factor EF-G